MPRKPRIEFEGAFYHVITRGNQRQKIFREPTDYQKYLQLLTIYKNRYHYSLYAYVLMGNHVHLLLETGETPLSKILQGINQTFTMYFNKKYRTVGHLFQGRYKAILCDRDNYLLALLKYIHYNPVRAKIAERPDLYPWSSHPTYTGKTNPYGLVDTDQVLRMFSQNKSRARRRYREFIHDGQMLKKDEVYATVDQRLQGDEEFVEGIQERYDGTVMKEQQRKGYDLEKIAQTMEQTYSIPLAALRSAGKQKEIMQARRLFSAAAKEYGYKGKEIAAYLKKDPASVTGYLQAAGLRQEMETFIRRLKEGKNVNI